MTAAPTLAEAEALLAREGHCLDAQRWQDWLALYAADAVYWVPCWKGDGTPTADPDAEVSLIYHDSRAALEDRVWRFTSGRSAASTPLPRTAHAASSIVLDGDAADPLVHASWTCHVFDPKHRRQHVFFGRYELRLVREAAGWRIARKKVLLANDYIPTMIDVYCL